MKEYLIECIDRTFDDEDYYKINKYIEDLKNKIDKAIEWVKDWTQEPDDWFAVDAKPSKLLEILRGEDND